MNRFRVELKALTEEGTFTGILSPYNEVDDGNDIVEPGAFTKTMQERGDTVPLLWQHKSDTPIGKLTLIDTPDALQVKGELLMELPEAQKAYALMKAGIVKGLSIGYETIKKAMDGGIRRLKEVRLFEGSLVTFQMAPSALVTAVKRRAEGLEAKDSFADELTERQLCDARYQMYSALAEALDEYVWDQTLTNEQKVAAAAESIQQFTETYLAWLPDYLKLRDEMYKAHPELTTKAGRTISAATAKTMGLAHEHVKSAQDCMKSAADILMALLADEADEVTSEPEAADKSEPVNHSAVSSLLTELKGLLK